MYKLRDYQQRIADEGTGVLSKYGVVYLAMEVRCGKTLTALEIARQMSVKKVLFLTKKKAMGSIQDDYEKFGYDNNYELTVINDESMHKLVESFDLIIHDEHHRFGSFPKPSKGAKMFKSMYGTLPQIYLSGTISPESYSQLYHQFWVLSSRGPWREYTNFFKWSREYVNAPYTITFTQAQAGFSTKVVEHILEVDMKPSTYAMCDRLLKDLVIEGKEEVILADTPAKLQQKLHQMYSGTIKFESGERLVFDTSKADFIKERFKGKKIAIFYKFIGELECLKQVFGDKLTNDIPEFNADPDKWFVSQIISGREGTNLSHADYIVFYNIDFSAVSYFQAKDRMTTIDRPVNEIFWLFARKGIEHNIYKSVVKKKTYTVSIFKQDFKVKSK
jgi:hypothetical protein